MNNQPNMADLPMVQPFDQTGVPSKRSLLVKQAIALVLPFVLLAVFAVFAPPTASGRYVVGIFGGAFILVLALALYQSSLRTKYERLYKYVQRGLVVDINPDHPQVRLDGYTGGNIRMQQWTYIPPKAWRDAVTGQVLDLSTLYRK